MGNKQHVGSGKIYKSRLSIKCVYNKKYQIKTVMLKKTHLIKR